MEMEEVPVGSVNARHRSACESPKSPVGNHIEGYYCATPFQGLPGLGVTG